ncbi:MAG: homoserine dehydrogenase [Bacteroidales bacterium]
MDTNNKQIIGLFGFGVVGEGLYHVLQHSHTTNAKIRKICIKDPDKPRSVSPACFTTVPEDILDDERINLVVELINDAEAAYYIVKQALIRGKSVVSGNKQMLAFHLGELLDLQKQTGAALLYDASACGSIPAIRNLEEYYDNDLLLSITGILNGSSNYVLSKVFRNGLDYQAALQQARDQGFLEADPGLDVGGFDALYKLVILSLHGFGTLVKPGEVFVSGIEKLGQADINYAREKGYRIKLVAQAAKMDNDAFNCLVLPKMVSREDPIYYVENEYNGVVINGAFYEQQFMFGKGAGGLPTGSSVLSDITARMHDYRYEYKKRKYYSPPRHTNDVKLKVYLRCRKKNDLQAFSMDQVTESLSTAHHHHMIGFIRLNKLLELKDHLNAMDGFLAFFYAEPDTHEHS